MQICCSSYYTPLQLMIGTPKAPLSAPLLQGPISLAEALSTTSHVLPRTWLPAAAQQAGSCSFLLQPTGSVSVSAACSYKGLHLQQYFLKNLAFKCLKRPCRSYMKLPLSNKVRGSVICSLESGCLIWVVIFDTGMLKCIQIDY
ncbi:hypothetical protein FKM82_017508 [Ascaphus truei]